MRGLADQYASLAAGCDSYADAVEAKRAEIIHVAEWLLEQVVEGVVISVALGAITGGAGTAAGLSAVAARVAAESPRFAAILEALRALAAGVAASVRGAREALATVRLTLTKFRDAAVARSLARGEAGALKLWWEREPGWLLKHEHSGSHTIERHVGKTDGQLLQRLRDQLDSEDRRRLPIRPRRRGHSIACYHVIVQTSYGGRKVPTTACRSSESRRHRTWRRSNEQS